jgi:diguanylate cyclase (GGDEF)-like protein
MVAITLAAGVVVVLPALLARACGAAVLVAGGWTFFLLRLGQRARLADQAVSDPLTGLYNRLLLPQRLREETARVDRHGGSLVLALLDLDDFKALNDSAGHLAGDEALRAFGRAIRESVRGSDLTFRYGGEEFVVLFPNATLADAVAALRRLRQVVMGTPFSAGVAAYPAEADGPTDLLYAADAGKGRIEAGPLAAPGLVPVAAAEVPAGAAAGEAPPTAG